MLQNEYERLKAEKSSKNYHGRSSVYNQPSSNDLICSDMEAPLSELEQNGSKEAMLAEAKALRIHKTELENKKRVLEDQNRELACSLKNLRQFIKYDHDANLSPLISRTSSFSRTSSLPRNSSFPRTASLPRTSSLSRSMHPSGMHSTKNHNTIINGSADLNLDNHLDEIR